MRHAVEAISLKLQQGDLAAAEAQLRAALVDDPQHGPLWNLYGVVAVVRMRPVEALAAFQRALAFNPEDLEAVQNLAQTWLTVGETAQTRLTLALQRLKEGRQFGWLPGRNEGWELQAVHDALIAALDAGASPEALPWEAHYVLSRLAAHGALARLGSFEASGRRLAARADRGALLLQLGRAGLSRRDRMELLHQHRLWGETAERAAAADPVNVPARGPSERIRLGFLSSDLRTHAVGTFVWPLFEHLDGDRFEIFAYSTFPGPADALQTAITGRIAAYRHVPGASPRQIADVVAADGLDVLVEIGGPTGQNPIEAMAHRLAPIQVSWLGYPHSTGLSTIDRILLDPKLLPPDPALLLETPLLMPRSWIAMSDEVFRDEPRPAREPPSAGVGHVTFGSANSGYKMSPACLDAWARVLAAVPESHFLLVRPEGSAPVFRERIRAAFAARGVSPERVEFDVVWGAHLTAYDRIDVSLDTLPVTGGTTTCESLWMGVPVVSLVGEALYERLSYSILSSAGLEDLAVDTLDAYVAAAVALAADVERRRGLRSGLRARIKAGPLGDTKGFARDFYDLMAATVRPGA